MLRGPLHLAKEHHTQCERKVELSEREEAGNKGGWDQARQVLASPSFQAGFPYLPVGCGTTTTRDENRL